jgi:hypothetical protein
LKLAPLGIVDEEHAAVGELGLGRLDRMAKDEVVGGFASSLGGPAQDGVLFGGESEAQSLGLRCHTGSVRHMTYMVNLADGLRTGRAGQGQGQGADLFAEEEARLSVAIREAQREVNDARVDVARADDVARHFDDVARMLATLDVDKTWSAATEVERRVLVDEFIEEILVLPDYLDVKVHGAPALHVLYQEVGMKDSGFLIVIVSEGRRGRCGHTSS